MSAAFRMTIPEPEGVALEGIICADCGFEFSVALDKTAIPDACPSCSRRYGEKFCAVLASWGISLRASASAEQEIDRTRQIKRCKWCGDMRRRLNRAELCASCQRVEKLMVKAKAAEGAARSGTSNWKKWQLQREVSITQKMKELCIEDGMRINRILGDQEFSSYDLERLLCQVSEAVCRDPNLYHGDADEIGLCFIPAQRRLLGCLLWEAFHYRACGERMRKSTSRLQWEAAKEADRAIRASSSAHTKSS